MAPQIGWLQERSRILPCSSLGSLQPLVCIPCSSSELMSGPWDSSRVAQMALCQVRLIILTSHELLQQKQHSKQVSALTYEPCTVSRSHRWRSESGHTQARTWECVVDFPGVPAHGYRDRTKREHLQNGAAKGLALKPKMTEGFSQQPFPRS